MDRLISRLYAAFPSLLRKWEKKAEIITFESTFWAPPPENPFDARVALVTTGGVHLLSDRPFDMEDRDGDPSFREIPGDVDEGELTITHNYYDTRDAREDVGVVFPLQSLRDMEREQSLGSVNVRHFSFMGHVTGRHLKTLMEESAPQVSAALRKDGVGAVLLCPA